MFVSIDSYNQNKAIQLKIDIHLESLSSLRARISVLFRQYSANSGKAWMELPRWNRWTKPAKARPFNVQWAANIFQMTFELFFSCSFFLVRIIWTRTLTKCFRTSLWSQNWMLVSASLFKMWRKSHCLFQKIWLHAPRVTIFSFRTECCGQQKETVHHVHGHKALDPFWTPSELCLVPK